MNQQEVVEEDHRKKLPSNFDARQRRVEWEEEQERIKKASHNTLRVLSGVGGGTGAHQEGKSQHIACTEWSGRNRSSSRRQVTTHCMY